MCKNPDTSLEFSPGSEIIKFALYRSVYGVGPNLIYTLSMISQVTSLACVQSFAKHYKAFLKMAAICAALAAENTSHAITGWRISPRRSCRQRSVRRREAAAEHCMRADRQPISAVP